MAELSARLLEVVDALPLVAGMRVLEVGCGPGAMAREIGRRIGRGTVVGIDRSDKAIALAKASLAHEGPTDLARCVAFRCVAIEDFTLAAREKPFDLVVAIRVGALDGRHPVAGELARRRIGAVLAQKGRAFIDGGTPLRDITEACWNAQRSGY